MNEEPTLHLMVGLPGAGKTTLARRLAQGEPAVRLTPDEWMLPLFGEPEADGKRDVLEGRLLWVAHEILAVGGSVVLDFGCWVAEERWAVRAVTEHAGGRFLLHFVDLPETDRRLQVEQRWAANPDSGVSIRSSDHDLHSQLFQAATGTELQARRSPEPPQGHRSWLAWAAHHWPTFPDLDISRETNPSTDTLPQA